MKQKLFLSKQRERELKTTVLIDIKLSRAYQKHMQKKERDRKKKVERESNLADADSINPSSDVDPSLASEAHLFLS